MKTITIELKHKDEIVKDIVHISAPDMDWRTEGQWTDSEFVGVLMASYIMAVEAFLKIHPCKDCDTYKQHQRNYEFMIGEQKELSRRMSLKAGN
jgi:hypothetical protein